MRRIAFVFFLFLEFFSALPSFAVPFRWRFDHLTLKGRNDSLLVTVKWTFTEGAVAENSAMVICPSLRGSVGELMLTPVCLYGAKPFYSNVFASGKTEERRILKGLEGVSFECVESFPREDWMDTLRVSFVVYDWSRRDGLVPVSSSNRWTYTRMKRPEVPAFPWQPLVPKRSVSARKVRFVSPVSFPDVSSRFNIHDGDNEEEITAFLGKVRKLSSSKTYHLFGSTLSVSLPPRGVSCGEALRRSRSCAESLGSYLQRAGAFRNGGPAYVGAGEEWDGVRRWVDGCSLRNDRRLLEILSMDVGDDERYRLIQREKPSVFETLESGCFPSVGQAVYEAYVEPLGFATRNFYRPVYDELPEVMSPYDFYYLASDYDPGSDEWLEVLSTGAQLNPESAELNMDIAMSLIQAGKLNAAVPFLRNIGESDSAKYVYAVWLYEMGRYDEALGVFEVLSRRSEDYRKIWDLFEPFVRWKTGNVDWERSYN